MARVHERAVSTSAGKEVADVGQWFLRGTEPNSLIRPRERLESFQGKRQVRAPLVAEHGMNLIHDHRTDRMQHSAAGVAREKDEQRLRRRHQDLRRCPGHVRPYVLRGVSRTNEHVDVRQRRIERADLLDRPEEIFLDVVCEGPEGRNIKDARAMLSARRQQRVDGRQKRGERLA